MYTGKCTLYKRRSSEVGLVGLRPLSWAKVNIAVYEMLLDYLGSFAKLSDQKHLMSRTVFLLYHDTSLYFLLLEYFCQFLS